jgi:Kef-type K+ transport system membrane component KefB
VALSLVAMLCSALVTEAIGVHAIFGAFLLGAVIPHNSRLARVLEERIEYLVTILLLPAFFAFTGMRTEIGLVSGVNAWLTCAAIIAVATAGKFGGTLIGARLARHDWRKAASLGILMNTRGLMELIVLNVGLDLGVISPTLFTMLVVMALVTTMATTPILKLVSTEAAVGRASISPQPSS